MHPNFLIIEGTEVVPPNINVLMTDCVFPFIFCGSSSATVNEEVKFLITGVPTPDRSKWDKFLAAVVLLNYRSRLFDNPEKDRYLLEDPNVYAVRMKTMLKDRCTISTELQHRSSHLKWTKR